MGVALPTTQIQAAGTMKKEERVTAKEMSSSTDSLVECPAEPQHVCNACEYCGDTCGNPECSDCATKLEKQQCQQCPKSSLPFFRPSTEKYYTLCQLRRHGNADSAWLLVGDTIYDATEVLTRHPGGVESILRKSGGRCDCTEDFGFHSKKARQIWNKHKVGKLCPCPKGHDLGENQCTIS